MKKIASAAIAAALVGVMAIPAPVSAASFNMSYGSQDRFVSERCLAHPNWRGCDDWRDNHHHWDRADYRNWYRWNQPSLGSVAAGLFGFAIGAAIVNGISNGNGNWSGDHVSRCEARYRSYNEDTDMFLGFDGDYHRCRL